MNFRLNASSCHIRPARNIVAVMLNTSWPAMRNRRRLEPFRVGASPGFCELRNCYTADDFSSYSFGRAAPAPLAPARQKARIIERISPVHPENIIFPARGASSGHTLVCPPRTVAATTNKQSVNENSSNAIDCPGGCVCVCHFQLNHIE